MFTSSGRRLFISGNLPRRVCTTSQVEASAVLTTGIYTERLPFTSAKSTVISAPSDTDPISRMNTLLLPLLLTGISSNFSTVDSSELMVVINIVESTRRFPAGEMELFFINASTTSSAERLYAFNFSGVTLITTVLALEPNGGAEDIPGTVANKGRTRVSAKSKISLSELVLLLNTNSPTGKEEASKRITCGGRAPGGKNAIVRFTCRATCADASAISVDS